MTAEVPELDWALLKRISARITAEVPGICRVCYDLTPKPVGAVEVGIASFPYNLKQLKDGPDAFLSCPPCLGHEKWEAVHFCRVRLCFRDGC